MSTISKLDVIRESTKTTGATIAQSEQIVNAFLNEIAEQLKQGNDVKLTGFVAFNISETAERKGRNPQTGEDITIPAGKMVRASVGQVFKDAVK